MYLGCRKAEMVFLRTGASLEAQVFKNCGWNTIRAYGFGGFNLEKGLAEGGGEVVRLEFLVIQVGVGGKDSRKKIGLG